MNTRNTPQRFRHFIVAAGLLLTLGAASASSILPFPGPGMPMAGGAVCSYPLDALSVSAVGAYSTSRKLRSAYAGNAFTMTRATGGTQAIGFVGCTVDVGTITSFCAGTTCSITTLNDQVGSLNCTQSTLANAPVIYTGGAIVAQINANPTMSLSGSSQFCSMGASSTTTLQPANSAETFFAVWRPTAGPTAGNANDLGGAGSMNSASNGMFVGYDNTPRLASGMSNADQAISLGAFPFTDMVMVRTTALTSGTSGTLYRNGSGSTASGNWSATQGNGQTITIGQSFRPHFFTGYVAEVYWFTSQLSQADSNALGANAATYFALTWTPI